MWNEPTEQELREMPRLYGTEAIPLKNKIVRMHFFIGGCDWYAVEYDLEKRVFFGFAILNDDLQCAEWGYFCLDELRSLRIGSFEVDRDLYWKPCKAGEVDRITAACGWMLKEARR